MPTSRVTACTFAGPTMTDLYITTAQTEPPSHGPPVRGGRMLHLATGYVGTSSTSFAR